MKKIMPDDWAAKISRLTLSTKSKLRGHHKGSHRSRRFGSSLDFSDFREYHVGDDVRQIDWNVFARTEKHFIKRFLDEQEMRVHILLDSTKSMSEELKWTFARQLAIALGLIVLNKDDRLSFSAVDGSKEPPFRRKGAMYKRPFIDYVSRQTANFNGSFAENASHRIPKDVTVLWIITDGLEPIESWEPFLKRLPRHAGDIRLLLVETEEEIDPDYRGDLRMVDRETNVNVNVTISERVVDEYKQKRLKHQAELETLCRRYGIRLMPVNSNEGLMHVMFHQLLKANWVH